MEDPLDENIQHSKRISLSIKAGLAGNNGERAEQTQGSFVT